MLLGRQDLDPLKDILIFMYGDIREEKGERERGATDWHSMFYSLLKGQGGRNHEKMLLGRQDLDPLKDILIFMYGDIREEKGERERGATDWHSMFYSLLKGQGGRNHKKMLLRGQDLDPLKDILIYMYVNARVDKKVRELKERELFDKEYSILYFITRVKETIRECYSEGLILIWRRTL